MKQANQIIIKITLTSVAISLASFGAVAAGSTSAGSLGGWLFWYLGLFAGLGSVAGVAAAGIVSLVNQVLVWVQRSNTARGYTPVHRHLAHSV